MKPLVGICLLAAVLGCSPQDGPPPQSLPHFVVVPGGASGAPVAPFLMGSTEVTRAQYLAVMGEDPSDSDVSTGPDDPVQRVNWYEALVFCNRLSVREGLVPVYSFEDSPGSLGTGPAPFRINKRWDAVQVDPAANGYRLPTVQEWLWAAREAFDPGRAANLDEVAWYAKNSGGRTHPVATKKANGLGLYDLKGNVFEWCQDKLNPLGNYRVDLGGSWLNEADTTSPGYRRSTLPHFKHSNIGFRVVRNL